MKSHEIDLELLNDIGEAIKNGDAWIAYDPVNYFLTRGDAAFFKTKEAADHFVIEHDREHHRYVAVNVQSYGDVMKNIVYSNDLLTSKTNDMNQENLDYLKDNLKYMGFGERLYPQLEGELRQGAPQFQLQLETEIGGKAFAAMLNFRKSGTSDLYFFNSFHATLQRKDGETVDQVFYLAKGKGVTAKEAYNLLDGRAVHKELTTREGKVYKAWIQLDFEKKDKNNNHEVKQFHEAYGYHLKEALSHYKITELKEPSSAERLVSSLQKGNLQSVSMEGGSSAAKIFIEANPQFKNINLYTDQLTRVPREEVGMYMNKVPGQSKETKQELDQAATKKTAAKQEGPKLSKNRSKTKSKRA